MCCRTAYFGFRIPYSGSGWAGNGNGGWSCSVYLFKWPATQKQKERPCVSFVPPLPRSPSPPSAPSLFVLFADLSFWQVKGERGRVDCWHQFVISIKNLNGEWAFAGMAATVDRLTVKGICISWSIPRLPPTHPHTHRPLHTYIFNIHAYT